MIFPRAPLWRRLAAAAAAASVLFLSIAGCAITGSSQPPADQLVTITNAGDSEGAVDDRDGGNAEAGGSQERGKTPTPASRPRRTPAATPTSAGPQRIDGLWVIYVDELPREARTTLRLIEEGGPFPFDQDDRVFQNREGILPSRPRGYYREYTVITPGENDRGARRIVAGEDGDLYYTDDHYDSFRRIMER